MLIKLLMTGLLFSATGASGVKNVPRYQPSSNDCSTRGEERGAADSVEANIRLLEVRPDGWEVELTVRNSGDTVVFVMTNPIRSDGSEAPYIENDGNDPSTLVVSVRVYPPPRHTVYSDYSGVKLERLPPNTVHTEKFFIGLPAEETMPPYLTTPTPRQINLEKIKRIKAAIGFLDEDDGVRDLVQHKRDASTHTYGLERLEKGVSSGKQIYELQKIIYSPSVELRSQK